ncbi:CD1247 N-terminal domain-containing protein [Thermoactinomyces sp. DSM 45892]|uniref:CD1247 N-terminal domain-containing protein n=1 Tax=Thermoactinomyces sp. DSM 45892 TaxID=1882753 RepID=UPI00089713EA|nr:CD1247 N-terminal domain-containing protein [Thermoactinomyces sp. DSM 45892]SDY00194.1 hypothetical protein SAMN05444416_101211 [Thermoactinomyces sp. DSM 45892]
MYDRLRREVSYVQGLMEGANQESSHPEGKAIQRLLDIVDELLEANEHLEHRFLELEEYVESIDDDLNDMELLVYDDEDDVDENDEDELCIVCPECGEDVYVDYEDVADAEIELLCPECHTVLIVEDASDIEPDNSGVDEESID